MPQGLVDLVKHFQLPPKTLPDPTLPGEILEFIVSKYGPLLEAILFKPAQVQLETIRTGMTIGLCSSGLARCSMYIGARIFQALKDGKQGDLRFLRSCLDRLGQHICTLTSENTFDRNSLSAGLELVFLYFITSNSQAGYTLFRNLIPTFLQVALLYFDLWSYQPDCTSILLLHALDARRSDIYKFVLTDALTSLAFGVPPLLEYDTTLPQLSVVRSGGRLLPAVVAPELTPEFIIMIVKISVWRSKNPGQSAPEATWKPLEAEVWTFQQSADALAGMGPLHSVARMAIVEGWRHAVLVYLYMGMCGVASDDPRVQSSTKQIMKLLQVVQEDWNTMNHFFIPCLMASICTPDEKHRAELSNAFLRVENTKPWMLKAMDYEPVIDHLWHGAAANGRPVRWEDYVDSRRAMLHID